MKTESGFLQSSLPSPLSRGSRVGLALAGTLLASCAVGPDYERPLIATGSTYAPASVAAPAAAEPGAMARQFVMGRDVPFAWWTEFQSPKLDALVETALRNSPNITAAQAALRQGQELVSAQRGFFYPTVGADFNAERQKLPGNLSSNDPGPQGNGTAIPPAGTAAGSPVIYNFYTAQLDLSFTPDVFGGNRRQVESLQAQADMLRYEMEATYVTLVNNVVASVIQEASLEAQVSATQTYIDENKKAVEILRAQLKAGYAMGIDVATQESALAQANALMPPLRKQLDQTHDLIRALCGLTPDATLDDRFDLASLHLPDDLPVSLPAKLLDQRPDVRAAEEQLHSASAQVGVAVADRLPQFTITGALGGGASEINQMFSPGGPFWSLIGDVAQPIFQGGTLFHRQKAAEAALTQAREQYRSAVITAFQNVADTLHAVQSDADALAAAAEAERAARVVKTLTEKQHQLGYVDFLTQLVAEETYQQALINLVIAQTNRFGDTAALFQALGGGWWNRVDQVATGNVSEHSSPAAD